MSQSSFGTKTLVTEGRFERFTLNKLNQFLLEFPVSEAGKDYIDRAYLAPSRNVQGGTRNVVSDIPCPKMGVAMPTESQSVEFKFCLAHIFSSQILGYLMQPPSLELRYLGRNDKKVRSLYTPDCALFDWRSGVYLEEYKSASDREHLLRLHPGKYAQANDRNFICPPALDVVHPWGFRFRVRFDDEIHAIGHANRLFLFSYLGVEQVFDWHQIKEPLLGNFTGHGYRSYDDLVTAGVNADDLNWAIATGHLHIDFDAALLDREPDRVNVFTSRLLLESWNRAIRLNGSRPPSRTIKPEALSSGSRIVFDGSTLSVGVVGATALHAFDESGKAISLTYGQLNSAREAGILALPSDIANVAIAGPLWTASPKDLQRALRKLTILETLDRGEKLSLEDQHSASAIRRWRKKVSEGESAGLSAIESLIDSSGARGFRGPHIDLQHHDMLNLWLEKRLSDPTCPTTEFLYEESKEKSIAHGFTPVGRSAFYVRVKNIRSVETIKKSAGHKNSYQLAPSYWMLYRETPMHGVRAMEVVHIDSTLLDIETSSSISGEALGRAWLTLAMCANTRRVVGMYLSYSPPSHVSSLMVLADIVRRTGRLPDAVIHDWGSEFKAKCLWYALTSLQITHHIRPKSAPRFGAVLERVFGITTSELLANTTGNTKLRKKVRSMSPLVDPSRFNGLWLADLYGKLEEYFFDVYDTRKHPATNLTPRDAYNQSLLVHGHRIHRCRNLTSILPIILPPPSSSRGSRIDPARGLFVNGRHYGHPLLAKLALKGSRPEIRINPFDPSTILAFLDGQWVTCNSNISAQISRLSEPVCFCLFEELRMERLIVKNAKSRSRARVLALCKSLNEKALKNIAYWESAEAQATLEITDLGESESEATDTSAYTRLHEKVRESVARHLQLSGSAT
ncbi:hypothetical protein AZ34_00435 [Hylemonella gracilis str. Niagara R]|uniref:Integrase catalytic domain-containing protein n=1 Tax=Hylemonella gracilis str. Niagara R TaxID=1458275 RepID=A0A016XMD4_9BURK|nr:DDE-type integrase/transposase/recombinase [Hylemonella gracilis]EYC52737.1 hypothetical protein AZ34_00435 [Hylemonella gracilis str. Niagara R]